ncbi:MAG: 1-acyl-sn-glycerol-3-phosphate acyltransferase [Pseudomonadota bacterium]
MTSLRERIDPLIAERSPWLFRNTPWARVAKPLLDKTLAYERSLEIGATLDPLTAEQQMVRLADMLCKRLTHKGLGNVPASGAALIVANHPTGIADGIMLQRVLSTVRTDTYFFANADIMKVMPQYETVIAPVEWRIDKRSRAKTRETMNYTRQAVSEGRIGVIFPAGRLAKRKGLRLHERPWMASAAMIARKFDLPIIPVNIRARNSSLFYLFDFLHPTLRDITLFYETLNKDRQPYHIEIGEPISASSLPKNSDEGIEILKREVLALGQPDYTLVSSKMRPASQLFGS